MVFTWTRFHTFKDLLWWIWKPGRTHVKMQLFGCFGSVFDRFWPFWRIPGPPPKSGVSWNLRILENWKTGVSYDFYAYGNGPFWILRGGMPKSGTFRVMGGSRVLQIPKSLVFGVVLLGLPLNLLGLLLNLPDFPVELSKKPRKTLFLSD